MQSPTSTAKVSAWNDGRASEHSQRQSQNVTNEVEKEREIAQPKLVKYVPVPISLLAVDEAKLSLRQLIEACASKSNNGGDKNLMKSKLWKRDLRV